MSRQVETGQTKAECKNLLGGKNFKSPLPPAKASLASGLHSPSCTHHHALVVAATAPDSQEAEGVGAGCAFTVRHQEAAVPAGSGVQVFGRLLAQVLLVPRWGRASWRKRVPRGSGHVTSHAAVPVAAEPEGQDESSFSTAVVPKVLLVAAATWQRGEA